MAQLIADSDGKISGRFTVPPNIPVGAKLMQFVGSEGDFTEKPLICVVLSRPRSAAGLRP